MVVHLVYGRHGVRIDLRPWRCTASVSCGSDRYRKCNTMPRRIASDRGTVTASVEMMSVPGAMVVVTCGANAEIWGVLGWFAGRDDIVHGFGGARLRLQRKQLG
jgi:hypothetical protein